jgi:ABC-type antimicrobial peptide transport system permease subunit
MQFLIERLVFSLVILTGGLLFNKVRVIAIFLAVIPLIIIVFTYFILPEQFSLRIIGFMIAIIIIILSGIYHNIQLKKIKKDLQNTLIEN